MPTTKLINNLTASAPFATTPVKVTSAQAAAQVTVSITAPLDITAHLSLQLESGSTSSGPWEVQSSLTGARGGTGRDGVSRAVYGWSGGVTPDIIGSFVRVNFTDVTGTWTLDATLTT